MTRDELRAVLQDFRDMIRERGPRECLEVAAVDIDRIPMQSRDYIAFGHGWPHFSRHRLPRLAARAALRWWRWANRDWRFVTVSEPTVNGPGLYVRWYSENR